MTREEREAVMMEAPADLVACQSLAETLSAIMREELCAETRDHLLREYRVNKLKLLRLWESQCRN